MSMALQQIFIPETTKVMSVGAPQYSTVYMKDSTSEKLKTLQLDLEDDLWV